MKKSSIGAIITGKDIAQRRERVGLVVTKIIQKSVRFVKETVWRPG